MGKRRPTFREYKKMNKSKWGLYKIRVSKEEKRQIRLEKEN